MLEKVLEMLPKTKKKKPFKLQKLRVIKAFNLARCKGYSRLRRLACSATAAAQQYPPHTSRLKTVRRTVFSTPLTLSGFESLTFWFVAKHSIQLSYQYIRYNQRIVIKNDVVYDMNCTICFASPYPQCTL